MGGCGPGPGSGALLGTPGATTGCDWVMDGPPGRGTGGGIPGRAHKNYKSKTIYKLNAPALYVMYLTISS